MLYRRKEFRIQIPDDTPSSVSATTTSVYVQVHDAMTFGQKEKRCYGWTIQVDMKGWSKIAANWWAMMEMLGTIVSQEHDANQWQVLSV